MRQKTLGLAVAIIGCFALVSASGAATTKAQKVTKIDVSTRAAVVHYLRSIHVNPKHAVIQRGLRNYAGAHCPGTRWTCANTKHTVVQIAKRGGQNRFLCKSSKCVVVQISGVSHGIYTAGRTASASPSRSGGNSGYCVKTGSGTLSGGGQTCSIVQGASNSSASNTAGIYEVTTKVSGLVQTVQFAATIDQTSSSGNNTACVTQGISQTASTTNTNGKPVNVSLGATQSILIKQDSASGANSAVNGAVPTTGNCGSQILSQYQNQTSIVNATGNITQNMNPSVDGLQGGNVSLDVEQNKRISGATGANSTKFSQTTNQQAAASTTSGHSVTQRQNLPDGDGTNSGGAFSGIVGTVNQDSTGKSTAEVTQDEIQCEDAANKSNSAALTACDTASDPVTGITVTQTQNGPVGLFTPPAKSTARVPAYHKGSGTSAQTGAVFPNVDTFKLTQTSSQHTDEPGQDVTVHQLNTMQGDCQSSGNGSLTGGSCQASQTATLNGGNGNGDTKDGYTAGSISNLLISCGNGHNSCTATPPPSPTLTATPLVDLNGDTTATSASFEFTDPATAGAHFNCTLDNNATVSPCGTPTTVNSANLLHGATSYSGLPIGQHTFSVTVTDSSGNTSNKPPLATFTWTVVPPCTIGAGTSPLAYSSMPSDVVNCGPSSEGFEADSTNEFGDEVTLSTAGGMHLASMSVDLQSYGCGVSGHWYSGDCVSGLNDTFTIPGGITATIYSVGSGDAVGSAIATSTVNPNIPYRPSADNTHCTGGDAGKWYDPTAGACRNSYSYLVNFNNWTFTGGPHTFANAEKVIWTVKFNTTHAGYSPIGESETCFGSAVGCGYDSLNVGVKTFTNAAAWPSLTTSPYAGTDVAEDAAFRAYDDPAYSGTHVALAAETGWSGFRPLGKIVLGP